MLKIYEKSVIEVVLDFVKELDKLVVYLFVVVW